MIKIVKKPWGKYLTLFNDGKICVKILEVNANKRLSLQFHQNKTEFWIPLNDHCTFKIQGKKMLDMLDPVQKTCHKIMPYEKHRLTAGRKKARVLEVSIGKIDENDIVRIEDDYGRDKD